MSRQVIKGGDSGSVKKPSTLSERFAQLEKQRTKPTFKPNREVIKSEVRQNRGGGGASRGGVRRGNGGRDTKPSEGAKRGGRKDGKKNNNGRNGRNSNKKKPPTLADLDKQLDAYRMKDPEFAKTVLDQELDEYTKRSNQESNSPEAASAEK